VYEPGRTLRPRDHRRRAPSLWRYKEWLPFDGDPVWSLDTGHAAGRRPGARTALRGRAVWVKNDTVSPSVALLQGPRGGRRDSTPPRVRADTIGCASTGQLANAVAAHAARAGLKAWIFIPDELEAGR